MKHLIPCLALALFAAVRAADSPKPVEIKLATILPVGTSGHLGLMEMRDTWQKLSAQSVKVTIYPGSADGEMQIVKKLRTEKGPLPAALVSAVGLSEIDRSVTCLQLVPMQFHNWAEVDHVREKIRGELERRLREKGFEVLFWADGGWVRYFSKSAAVHPEDFKPMKMFVWSGDPLQVTMLRSLGYHPVSLETEQILTSLSRDMITALPVPPFIANALQYNRYVSHMVDFHWAPIIGALVVRRDTWQKIPAALQADLLKTAEATGAKLRQRNREEDEESIAAMKKRGLVVHSATPEIVAEWQAMAEKVYPQIRGTNVPADLFDLVQAEIKAFRAANGKPAP
jgi:TRAP-type C4-dicarboxylate transport system substrate-binding protein